MAGDSAISAAAAAWNSGVLIPDGVSVTTTGAGYIDMGSYADNQVLFIATSTAAAEIVIQDGGEYSGGSVGDVTVTTTGAKSYVVGPFESARFKDSDGYVKIYKSTGDTTAVTVQAITLP
jgi:hypothetical protein